MNGEAFGGLEMYDPFFVWGGESYIDKKYFIQPSHLIPLFVSYPNESCPCIEKIQRVFLSGGMGNKG